MAMASPSLNSLQAQLRSGKPAPSAAKSKLLNGQGAGSPSAAAGASPQQGVKRTLPAFVMPEGQAAGGAPPAKKPMVKQAAPTKAPGARAGAPGAGAVAKAPGAGGGGTARGTSPAAGTITKSPSPAAAKPLGAGCAPAKPASVEKSIAKSPGAAPGTGAGGGGGVVAKVAGASAKSASPQAPPPQAPQATAAPVAAVKRPSTGGPGGPQPPASVPANAPPGPGQIQKAKAVGLSAGMGLVQTRGKRPAVKGASVLPPRRSSLAQPPPQALQAPQALQVADGPPSPVPALAAPAIHELVAAIDAAPGNAKVRHCATLAQVLGQTLQMEHINHFLRALKKQIAKRANEDGMPPRRAVPDATPRPGAPPAAGGAAGKAPAPQPQSGMAKVKAAAAAALPQQPPLKKAKAPGGPPGEPLAKSQQPPPLQPARAQPASQPPPAGPPTSPEVPPGSPPLSDAPPSEHPLFVLIGELTADPVCADGVLNEARLGEVLKRLWDSAARRPKDWVAAWNAMNIAADRQAEALHTFLNLAFIQTRDSETAPMVIAELAKSHKVKLKSVEEVLVTFGHNLDGILAVNEDAWHVYAQFLVHIFPKPSGSGWGWSRVGWAWQPWWQFVEKCIPTLEPARASDVLAMVLRLVQDREGQTIMACPGWSEGDKLPRVVAKLEELGSCGKGEALEKLAMQGVIVEL